MTRKGLIRRKKQSTNQSIFGDKNDFFNDKKLHEYLGLYLFVFPLFCPTYIYGSW